MTTLNKLKNFKNDEGKIHTMLQKKFSFEDFYEKFLDLQTLKVDIFIFNAVIKKLER